jgi:hypothetical protein
MPSLAQSRRVGVILLAAIIACDDHSAGPLEPSIAARGAPRVETGALGAAQAAIVERVRPLRRASVVRATIGPAGGALRLDPAGLFVIFPPGAVTENIAVKVSAPRGDRVVYVFEPHGARFRAPVLIAQESRLISYAQDGDASSPAVHAGYLGVDWRPAANAGVAAFQERFATRYQQLAGRSYVAFATTHFSAYALATGRTEEDPGEDGEQPHVAGDRARAVVTGAGALRRNVRPGQ